MRAYRQESAIATVWEAQDRLLVAIGTSTDSARLVRETARLANRMKAEWIAVHVEDPSRPDSEEKKRVFDVLNLAGQLGAETTVLSGSDPVAVIAEYARRRNVTKIDSARSPARNSRFSARGSPISFLPDTRISTWCRSRSRIPRPASARSG